MPPLWARSGGHGSNQDSRGQPTAEGKKEKKKRKEKHLNLTKFSGRISERARLEVLITKL